MTLSRLTGFTRFLRSSFFLWPQFDQSVPQRVRYRLHWEFQPLPRFVNSGIEPDMGLKITRVPEGLEKDLPSLPSPWPALVVSTFAFTDYPPVVLLVQGFRTLRGGFCELHTALSFDTGWATEYASDAFLAGIAAWVRTN